MKRSVPAPKPLPRKIGVCLGCGFEYDPWEGDPTSEIAPGTEFKSLPEGWVCPHCGEPLANFIEIEV